MAQGSDTKFYVALGVLALLGGAYYMQTQGEKRQAVEHSAASTSQKLPEIALSEDATKLITRIVIDQPQGEGEGAKPANRNILVKEGDSWKLAEPVQALANQKNVESLLENLTKLELKEQVSSSKDNYKQYGVSDDAAMHVAVYEGDKIVRELWAGKSGGRGQMGRVDGQEGVYILGGFSSFLYNRDTKGWRDLSVLELDPEEATAVSIKNEHGEFTFKKEGGEFKGKFKKAKAASAVNIADFDAKKVKDMLSAYKKLNASGFADGKALSEVGLEEPAAVLTIELEDTAPVVLHFGSSAEGSSKWAKLASSDQIYSISSWASDWAFAEETKFQSKKDEKSDEDDDDHGMPGGLPPGMEMPMGMGHP
jgi:hypothetical protein